MATADELYNEGERLKDDGDTDGAIAKWREALEQDENHVLAHLGLSVAYNKVGKPDEPIQHGQRACEIDPSDPFNFTALSVTYQRAFQNTQNPQYIQLAEDAMARSRMMQEGM